MNPNDAQYLLEILESEDDTPSELEQWKEACIRSNKINDQLRRKTKLMDQEIGVCYQEIQELQELLDLYTQRANQKRRKQTPDKSG